MKTQTINIDGIIFNYTYNRSTKKYHADDSVFDSKEEMEQILWERVQEWLCEA